MRVGVGSLKFQRGPVVGGIDAEAETVKVSMRIGMRRSANGRDFSEFRLAPSYFEPRIDLKSHLFFTASSMLLLMLAYSLLRLALLLHNRDQIGGATVAVLAEAFVTGLRFDLRLAVFACIPLLLSLPSLRMMNGARVFFRWWLSAFASVTLFLGIIELDFFREFNQRLNGLVFQYLKEDPGTVMSMIWHGFPVMRYLLAWAAASVLLGWAFARLDRCTRPPRSEFVQTRWRASPPRFFFRLIVFLVCLSLAVVAMRGTLRQGPPLRWGDAFTTDSIFANQLGLNATLMLVAAMKDRLSGQRDNIWKSRLPPAEALALARKMLLTGHDVPVGEASAAILRDFTPPAEGVLPIRNVIVILMESFAGKHVGILGGQGGVTPYFDRLASGGLLFTRFFANGTHTHQGTFVTLTCFPNLPGFEYLMQTPEGSNDFSGLPQLLGARGMDGLYVYNGDFAWDNQSGFFGRQGIRHFIGRFDYENPVVFDPTWGVSDQDMFDRALEELTRRPAGKPFYAILQTLSNHTPFALPEKLPVEPVTGFGNLDAHLTAMRYSDWALGKFFEKAGQAPFYDETLFVIVGDHGFGSGEQLTEMNLARFNVPLLLIAPGIQDRFGKMRDTVATQLDVVPTILGRLGGTIRHQCWGRDLLSLPAEDRGFGVIKPSGNDQTVAILSGDEIVVQSKSKSLKTYSYRLWTDPKADELRGVPQEEEMRRKLDAFIQVATRSLLDNTTGLRIDPRSKANSK
jgi:phosphoglycerol transferase MdoB-like AlkP superfamily enzyme